MAIDHVGTKVGGSSINLPLDNPAVVEALRSGKASDLHKILTDYKITAADWEEFIAGRGREYEDSVVKSVSSYASDASAPEPSIEDFIDFSGGKKLDTKEQEYLADIMGTMLDKTIGVAKSESSGMESDVGGGTSGKGMKAATLDRSGKAKAAGTGKASGVVPTEVATKIENDLSGADDLFTRIASSDYLASIKRQAETELNKIEQEFKRIWSLARSGTMDPCVLVLAITKLNMEKNGVLFAMKSKEIMKINDDMNASFKTMESNTSTSDPAKYYSAQSKIQEGSQSLKLVMEDLNAITKATETASSTGKNLIESVHSISMEMIRKTSAPSA